MLIVQNALKALGVTDHEPGVVRLLLNYMYRYSTDIIADADNLARLSGKAKADYQVSESFVRDTETRKISTPSLDV